MNGARPGVITPAGRPVGSSNRWEVVARSAAQGLPQEWSRYLANRWARLACSRVRRRSPAG